MKGNMIRNELPHLLATVPIWALSLNPCCRAVPRRHRGYQCLKVNPMAISPMRVRGKVVVKAEALAIVTRKKMEGAEQYITGAGGHRASGEQIEGTFEPYRM